MIQRFYDVFLSRPEQRHFHNLAGTYYETSEVNELRAGLHYQRGESYQEAYDFLVGKYSRKIASAEEALSRARKRLDGFKKNYDPERLE